LVFGTGSARPRAGRQPFCVASSTPERNDAKINIGVAQRGSPVMLLCPHGSTLARAL